jgi:hypothetical protein
MFVSVVYMMTWVKFAFVLSLGVAVVLGQHKPLGVSLECSACEVTAREIFYGYQNRSKNDKFAGTELEVIEVLEGACKRLGKYRLSQEAFGAHVKVFSDPNVKYDIQNVEPVQIYSKKEEESLQGAIGQLVLRCQHYCGRFEDELQELIAARASEMEIRKFMCLEETDVCEDAKLAAYRVKQSVRRKKWKKKTQRAKLESKWAQEVNADDATPPPTGGESVPQIEPPQLDN